MMLWWEMLIYIGLEALKLFKSTLNMSKLAKFKDSIEHPKKNSICLLTVISIDQEYQQGASFKAFCDLINQEYAISKRIHKLIIVETGYLKRHYIRIDPALTMEEASEKAHRIGKEWIKMHKPYLDELAIPYEIKS